MSLRQLAENDLSTIMENPLDFGWAVTIIDPDGVTNASPIYGNCGDIGQVIDPDLGVAVSGRKAYLTLRLSTLTTQGLGIPVKIADRTKKPWRVTFNDVNGASYTFNVIDSAPDRVLGVVTCEIGLYE